MKIWIIASIAAIAIILVLMLWARPFHEGFETSECPSDHTLDDTSMSCYKDVGDPTCVGGASVCKGWDKTVCPEGAQVHRASGKCRITTPLQQCSGGKERYTLVTYPYEVTPTTPGTPPNLVKTMVCVSPNTEMYDKQLIETPGAPVPKCRAGFRLALGSQGGSSGKCISEAEPPTASQTASANVSTQSGYADVLTEMGQSRNYGTASPAASTGSQPAGVATTTGTTTGGTSTTALGPNSGGTGLSGKTVFGPVFTGLGAAVAAMGGDSSKTNKYPELLGGGESKPSTRIDGVGIVAPSKNWSLTQSGDLPSSASLGSDENSKYLPTSRQPGDQDLIPDPYRVSKTFTTSSYSSKTDPVPFLTDFSAFQK